jgi:hypothetical protein
MPHKKKEPTHHDPVRSSHSSSSRPPLLRNIPRRQLTQFPQATTVHVCRIFITVFKTRLGQARRYRASHNYFSSNRTSIVHSTATGLLGTEILIWRFSHIPTPSEQGKPDGIRFGWDGIFLDICLLQQFLILGESLALSYFALQVARAWGRKLAYLHEMMSQAKKQGYHLIHRIRWLMRSGGNASRQATHERASGWTGDLNDRHRSASATGSEENLGSRRSHHIFSCPYFLSIRTLLFLLLLLYSPSTGTYRKQALSSSRSRYIFYFFRHI